MESALIAGATALSVWGPRLGAAALARVTTPTVQRRDDIGPVLHALDLGALLATIDAVLAASPAASLTDAHRVARDAVASQARGWRAWWWSWLRTPEDDTVRRFNELVIETTLLQRRLSLLLEVSRASTPL